MKLEKNSRVTYLPGWALTLLGRHDGKYGRGAADARISRMRVKRNSKGSRAVMIEETKTYAAREEAAALILKLRTAEAILEKSDGSGAFAAGRLSDPASLRAERRARADAQTTRSNAAKERAQTLAKLVKLDEALVSSDVLLCGKLFSLEMSCRRAEEAYLAGVRRRLPCYGVDREQPPARPESYTEYKEMHSELEGIIKRIVRAAEVSGAFEAKKITNTETEE